MTITLAVSFLAFIVSLIAVWACSEISKKTMAKATALIKDHSTEMYKLASQNDFAVASLKEDVLGLRMELNQANEQIRKEAEMRSREMESIRDHLEDMEKGWGPKKPNLHV